MKMKFQSTKKIKKISSDLHFIHFDKNEIIQIYDDA